MQQHIVIVEDDQRLSDMMAQLLEGESYRVSCIYQGSGAANDINRLRPDILLLDMMLPGCDGLTILTQLDDDLAAVIIMITAKKDEYLEVSALNLGVHDYITKPVRPHILLARIKALSRLSRGQQHRNEPQSHLLKVQDLSLDTLSRSLFLAETLVDISTAEYEIIAYFMRHPATVLSREAIIADIRKIDYDGLDRSIDMRISALRKKLDDSNPPYKYIKTIRGKGYILQP